MSVERTLRFDGDGSADLLTREWLVTNGIGGYASGTLCGQITRRFHGLLVAALPEPSGRMMMLNHLVERVHVDERTLRLDAQSGSRDAAPEPLAKLVEFALDDGMPVWRYDLGGGRVIEKRLVMPHHQNTVCLSYELVAGSGSVDLDLEPWLNFRPHEGALNLPLARPYAVKEIEHHYEITATESFPALRIVARSAKFHIESRRICDVHYGLESSRGYDAVGDLHSPGYFRVEVSRREGAAFCASTEEWSVVDAMTVAESFRAERTRRARLLGLAPRALQYGLGAELTLAADSFVITPQGRVQSATRARAQGDEIRSVIAGYHWFTDWGRDTMISLEGLALVSGRHAEAGYILRTFSHYVRDGLLPNLFPEGTKGGLYHTADATLWFFHAVHRYVTYTGDRTMVTSLLPLLRSIAEHHAQGTRFGIRVDPTDGLLTQGTPDLPLTWMDAKVGDLVVTPRRGKAVEINALYYNMLVLLASWLREADGDAAARPIEERAALARASFNERFWFAKGGYLFDVVDGEAGEDDAFRPNQVLAISLDHPVLDEDKWESVMSKVEARLLTPFGLRSLAPGNPAYKAQYFGDLRARDLAYHQGTVWAWLIGPFVDAWLKLHPRETARARELIRAFDEHCNEACIGSISEIFDAEPPYTPRGCIAQAWSVAEVLRLRAKLA